MHYLWPLMFVATVFILITGSASIKATPVKRLQAERIFHVFGYSMLTFTGCFAFPVIYMHPLVLCALGGISTVVEYIHARQLRWTDIAANWAGIGIGYVAVMMAAYAVAIAD